MSMVPLAEQLRPTSLENYVGQSHLVGENAAPQSLSSQLRLPSPCGDGQPLVFDIWEWFTCPDEPLCGRRWPMARAAANSADAPSLLSDHLPVPTRQH